MAGKQIHRVTHAHTDRRGYFEHHRLPIPHRSEQQAARVRRARGNVAHTCASLLLIAQSPDQPQKFDKTWGILYWYKKTVNSVCSLVAPVKTTKQPNNY